MSKAREEAGRLRYKFLEEIYPDVLLGHRASNYNLELAKECALICVDEILELDVYDMSEDLFNNHIEFWEEVKKEIENLQLQKDIEEYSWRKELINDIKK